MGVLVGTGILAKSDLGWNQGLFVARLKYVNKMWDGDDRLTKIYSCLCRVFKHSNGRRERLTRRLTMRDLKARVLESERSKGINLSFYPLSIKWRHFDIGYFFIKFGYWI